MNTLWPWVLRAAGFVTGVILMEGIRRLWKKKPCWLFGHRKNYVGMERWSWKNGNCNTPAHPIHRTIEKGDVECFNARWVCTKCPTLGLECIGSIYMGAWTISQKDGIGVVVADLKEWANMKDKGYQSDA